MAKTKVIRGKLVLKENTLTESTTNRILSIDSTTGEITDRPAIDTSGLVTASLADGKIWVGDVSNAPVAVTMSGDVTITNAGVAAIGTGVIVNADINASAAIALSKLAAVTASRVMISDGSGFITAADTTTYPSLTEFAYGKGVTSAIQTQLNAKQATITGGATTITTSNLTVSRALVSDGSGKVSVSAATSTEVGYLSGVTSAIQTQLGTKIVAKATNAIVQTPTVTQDGWAITWDNGAGEYTLVDPASQGVPTGGTARQVLGKLSGTNYDTDWLDLVLTDITDVTAVVADVNILTGAAAAGVTSTEFQYLNGVTSAIQTQIDTKLATTLAQNRMFVGNASGVATTLAPGTNGYFLTSQGGVPTWTAPGVKWTTVEIGDWDMDTNATATVAHGIADYTKIRSVDVLIRPDSGAAADVRPLVSYNDSTGVMSGGITGITSTNVVMARLASGLSGVFDSTNFNATSYNRGWIMIGYVD